MTPSTAPTEATDVFVHKSGEPPPETDTVTAKGGDPTPPVHVVKHKTPKVKGEKKPGFMVRMGHFFRRLFGAE